MKFDFVLFRCLILLISLGGGAVFAQEYWEPCEEEQEENSCPQYIYYYYCSPYENSEVKEEENMDKTADWPSMQEEHFYREMLK